MYGRTPQLIYDGDCAFCRYLVAYARSITGEEVRYRTYQDVGDGLPDIDEADFRASIQWLDGDARSQGAEAAFKTLDAGDVGVWLWLYRHLPGFAALAEIAYTGVSRRRRACHRFSRWMFGPELVRSAHTRTAELLIRGIALCAASAFASLWWQVEALMGASGILPAAEFFDAVSAQYGVDGYFYLPSLLWASSADWMLHALCGAGLMACLALLSGRSRTVAAIVAYLCYLSLVHAGQIFMAYQWDMLLLECLVLVVILSRSPTLGVWTARLLLFRFMFMAGVAKVLSGDPTWANATALDYHFETQPLPGPFAWYAHFAPNWLLAFGSQATLFIEIVLAFAVLAPRRVRLVPLFAFVALEALIFLTGSYNFFNVLTVVLCASLLDDGMLSRVRWRRSVVARPGYSARILAAVVIVVGLLHVVGAFYSLPTYARVTLARTQPLYLANPYGLFAVMTTTRDELVLEGRAESSDWQSYELPFKPGATDRRPGWATPHQPRLDWQLWFAAFGEPRHAPWVYGLTDAVLRADPGVLKLFEVDPFAGERPAEVRIVRYRYRFASPEQRSSDGAWWTRRFREVWLGPVRLRVPQITHEPLELPPAGQGDR